MPSERKDHQTDETNIIKLAAMAKADIASGKAQYFSFSSGEQAERDKILMWIIDHSPKWRSDGSAAIKEEMKRLGL